jgi:hypothetical protein
LSSLLFFVVVPSVRAVVVVLLCEVVGNVVFSVRGSHIVRSLVVERVA